MGFVHAESPRIWKFKPVFCKVVLAMLLKDYSDITTSMYKNVLPFLYSDS